MKPEQIVIDTNVIVAALRSKRGASYKLLSLIDSGKFEISISVPLILEYEYASKQLLSQLALTEQEIDDVIDYICLIGHQRTIYYLWRPFLPDPKDDMVLELAVAAECESIVTFNLKDFRGIEKFSIKAVPPKEFLQSRGELP